jgi:hypothetical protein
MKRERQPFSLAILPIFSLTVLQHASFIVLLSNTFGLLFVLELSLLNATVVV